MRTDQHQAIVANEWANFGIKVAQALVLLTLAGFFLVGAVKVAKAQYQPCVWPNTCYSVSP